MHDPAVILALKIVLVSGIVSLAGWVALYTVLTRGGVWRNPVGLTLILKSLLMAGMFVPALLSLFFHLSARDSRAAGWADVALIGLVTPVMAWRCAVWVRMHRLGRLPRDGRDR